MLRKQINPQHPVFGGHKMLTDEDRLEPLDETACVSTLLSLDGGKWTPVMPSWSEVMGRTVGWLLGPDSTDADKDERVFRRRV